MYRLVPCGDCVAVACSHTVVNCSNVLVLCAGQNVPVPNKDEPADLKSILVNSGRLVEGTQARGRRGRTSQRTDAPRANAGTQRNAPSLRVLSTDEIQSRGEDSEDEVYEDDDHVGVRYVNETTAADERRVSARRRLGLPDQDRVRTYVPAWVRKLMPRQTLEEDEDLDSDDEEEDEQQEGQGEGAGAMPVDAE